MTRLNSDAHEIIELARDLDDPSEADRARHRARLVGRLGAAAALTISLPASASGAVAGVGSAGGVAGAAIWKSAVVFALLGGLAGGAVCAVGELTRPQADAGSISTVVESPALPSLPQPPAEERGAARPAASAPNADEVSPAAPQLAPTRREARELPPIVEQPPMAPGGTLQEEIDLVRRAHEALRAGDPALALQYVGRHAARFPNGALAQERAAARVLAVCSLHQAGATDEARAFLAARPDSPLAARVRAACGLR